MVRAHQNLNGSRDLTPPLSEIVCHSLASSLALATINLSAKFEVSISTRYENKKADTKFRKCGGLGLNSGVLGRQKVLMREVQLAPNCTS